VSDQEALPASYGKYELVELIGEGGMARVYRALQTGPMGFRKEVALKQILPHVSRVEKMVKALINEARLGGNLRHPNVVEVYDFGQVDDSMYIAMEYIRGHTLHEVLDRTESQGPIPPRIVAQIAQQLCQGLAYAHAATDVDGRPMNLIHRDLKPANVIIDANAVVKIMDFGIARADTNLFTTTTGMTKGTPVYMSPEQVRKCEDRPIDGRSDLFSLGAVIGEMVTGRTVFSGTELYEILHKIAGADTREAMQQIGHLAPPLVPVLQRALKEDRDERYPDAESMGQALAECAGALEGDEELGPWLRGWMGDAPATPGSREPAAPQQGDRPDIPPTLSASAEPIPEVRRTLAVADPAPPAAEDPPASPPLPRAPRWPQLMGIAGLLALLLSMAFVVVVLLIGPRWLGSADAEGDTLVIATQNATDPAPAGLDPGGPDEAATPAPVPAETPEPATPDHASPHQPEPATSDPVSPEPAEPAQADAPAPAAPRPVILQAKAPDVIGGLTPMDVAGPISLQQAALDACYRPGLQRDPDLVGSLRINLVIETDGSVAQTQISNDELGDEQVSACFVDVLGGMRFPQPSNGQPAIVEYTFALTREEGT